jgi:hypothetical protein
MQWRKLGLVYGPDGSQEWAQTHAMIPTPVRIDRKTIRVFTTFCDKKGIGSPGYVDVSAKDPRTVINVSKTPLLERGQPGTFDENGMLVCSVTPGGNGTFYMYYAGFELSTSIRYRLLTGLAISTDNGLTWSRYSRTPVLERSSEELFFRGGPFCIASKDGFKMWYVAGDKWTDINGKQMPVYDIRYLESKDGLTWPNIGEVQIEVSDPDEHGFGRPYVIPKRQGGYRMFYSVRRRSVHAYRLGYAESDDGRKWIRMDNKLCLNISKIGFDSEAIMYAAPIEANGELYLFYNGNDFGRDGFAVAVLENE